MMAEKFYTLLENRGLIRVTGADARDFLQGLISNDVNKVDGEQAIHAAFLTPQGKYLHDFFIVELGGALMVDCEAAPRLDDLMGRLAMYKLRSDVEISDASPDFTAAALFGDGVSEAIGLDGGVSYMDPRLDNAKYGAGARAVLPSDGAAKALEEAGFSPAPYSDYDLHRMTLGLTEGSLDMEVGKAILLENGFDEWGSADWEKGCYLGQELTARTKHRSLIKKRLIPVKIDGPAPMPGESLTLDGEEAGQMRSSTGQIGLALIRLEMLEKAGPAPFTAGRARLTPKKPAWADFQVP